MSGIVNHLGWRPAADHVSAACHGLVKLVIILRLLAAVVLGTEKMEKIAGDCFKTWHCFLPNLGIFTQFKGQELLNGFRLDSQVGDAFARTRASWQLHRA